MSYQKQIRWSVGATFMCLTSILSGCATLPEEKFVSKCTGLPVDAALEIVLDASGNPTEVVHAGSRKNANVIFVCPDANVTWTLPGTQDFTIRFVRQAPFRWTSKDKGTKKSDGKMNVPGQIKRKNDVHCDGYKYAVEVNGSTVPLDPIIIVDK